MCVNVLDSWWGAFPFFSHLEMLLQKGSILNICSRVFLQSLLSVCRAFTLVLSGSSVTNYQWGIGFAVGGSGGSVCWGHCHCIYEDVGGCCIILGDFYLSQKAVCCFVACTRYPFKGFIISS